MTQEPHSETIPTFLQKPVKDILFLIKKMNLNLNTTTKEIYNVLNREIIKIPKIVTKNPNTDFNPIFKAITKPFLSEFHKEHLFLQAHNILPTKDRLLKCRRVVDPECESCNEPETLIHLFQCATTNPAIKIIQRKIAKLYNDSFIPNFKQILLFQFPPPKKKQNFAIWLSANLSLIVWKKRKKTNFIKHFITSLKTKEDNLKTHPKYKKWF